MMSYVCTFKTKFLLIDIFTIDHCSPAKDHSDSSGKYPSGGDEDSFWNLSTNILAKYLCCSRANRGQNPSSWTLTYQLNYLEAIGGHPCASPQNIFSYKLGDSLIFADFFNLE